jgi:transposase
VPVHHAHRSGQLRVAAHEPGSAVALSPAQLAMLIEGIDWPASRKGKFLLVDSNKVELGIRLDLDKLLSGMVLLHGLLRDMVAVVEHRDGEIERLQTIIKQLQRTQFGRRSKRLDPDQLALGLDDLDGDIGRAEASGPHVDVEIGDKRAQAAADYLSRKEVVIDVANAACPCCGDVRHSIGESVREMLDWIRAQLRVLRITRPKHACRATLWTRRPRRKGRSPAGWRHRRCSPRCGPANTATTLHSIGKRRSSPATASNWSARPLPLGRRRVLVARGAGRSPAQEVFASDDLFADDTPVPVLDPGRGRTKTGQLWGLCA